ncbi:hypothetical protein AAFF_G00018320 [Aldrovandia affinis]|uniref:Uncharacterized protein n=1 Tax=Aldrovandia affinis TaxID=143900 RepID=A0AAD7S5V0_9TELE|nr:hypothetical protein AAFF_G00018320 [Aldrovandia affinis]
MPQQVLTDSCVYNARTNNSDLRVGFLRDEEASPKSSRRGLSLATQLECLSQDVSHAFLIVAPECIAVFRDRTGRYGLFDSHSRSARGLPHSSGTAIVLTFCELSDMVDHLHELFADRSPYASYELMPVSFESDHGFSETPGQSADVAMTKPTTAVPEAQTCVEANIPRSKTDDGQPKNLDFNRE